MAAEPTEPQDDDEPDRCHEEPRRKSICRCRCTRLFEHKGKHYCGDCGWSWGRGRLTDEDKKAAAL